MLVNSKPSIAILHYAAPPTVGGVESTIAAHARLCADHGYTVKVVTGRGEPFDPRVPVQTIPTIDSRHRRRSHFLQEQGLVNDAARRGLYSLADALLFPSAREGFGIPILEAGMAHLPIFCADIAPFHESAGEWANYFALDEAPAAIAMCIADTLARDAQYQLKQRVVHDYAWPRIFAERIEPLLK